MLVKSEDNAIRFYTANTATFSPITSILVNGASLSWLRDCVTTSTDSAEGSHTPEEEAQFVAGLNTILAEFDDPKTHKVFNTVEELFAELEEDD